MTVDVYDLIKRFGQKEAVNISSYHIDAGEMIGLVGSNGAGKTTFLRLVLDLLRADEGSVHLDGKPVHESMAWKLHTGSYLDESFLIDFLTTDEFFAFTGKLYGLSEKERSWALAPYQFFYTDEVFGETTKFLRDLSKGNGKKIGVIAAMFIEPRLLILDEPFANLDPPSQIRLKQLLMELNARCGTTMIISSHDLGHVTNLCKRITVLEKGRQPICCRASCPSRRACAMPSAGSRGRA
jgi:ABC-2 type transport system ATP-binding protein